MLAGDVDFLVELFSVTPTSAEAGNGASVEVSWTVRNQGVDAPDVSDWFDGFYLSEDQFLDVNDVFTGFRNVGAGELSGDTYNFTQTIEVANLAGGEQFLLLVVNDGNAQTETDTTNNVAFANITLIEPDVDLQPLEANIVGQEGSPVAVVAPETPFTLSWIVANAGLESSGAFRFDDIYLSTDMTLDFDDAFLTTEFTNLPIAANGTTTYQTEVTLGPETGNFFLIIDVDAGNDQFETDDVNQPLVLPIFVGVPDVDLIPSIYNISGDGFIEIISGEVQTYLIAPAGSLTVDWSIFNAGSDDATVSRVDRIFLSDDPIFDGSDVLLASAPSTDITPAFDSSFQTATFSYGPIIGAQYLLLVADADNRQVESDETNNVTFVPILATTADSDLVIENVTAPATAFIGDAITVTWTTRNAGTADALGNWFDYVYLTQDPDNISPIELVTLFPRSDLAAGETSALASTFFSVPELTPGDWFLVVRADAVDNVPEADETNNDAVVSIQLVAPNRNLTLQEVNAPTTIVQGDFFNVSWTVESTGTDAVEGLWFDRVYISTNATLDSGDLLIGTFDRGNLDPLAPGESYSLDEELFLVNRPNGDFFLIVVVDQFGGLGETDTTDNLISMPIAVTGADLALVDVVVDDSVFLGQSVEVTYTVANQGNAIATRDWGDLVQLLNSVGAPVVQLQVNAADVSPLGVGESYSRTFSFNVPFNIPVGDYTLRIVANSGGLQAESNRLNNTLDTPVAVNPVPLPDLIVTSIVAPVEGIGGQEFDLTWTVTNVGNAPASGPWVDQVFGRSETTGFVVTPSFDFTFFGSLNPGESVTRTQRLEFPQVLDSIRWEVTTDRNGQVGEGSAGEVNNQTFADTPTDITLPPLPADLIVTSMNQPAGTILSGETLSVSFTVLNQGESPTDAPVWSDYVWISQDPSLIFDDSPGGFGDQFINLNPYRPIAFDNLIPLDPGESYVQTVEIPLPIDASGTWYLYSFANGLGTHFPFSTQGESSRGNNLRRSDPFQITLSPTANLVTASVVPSTSGFSGQLIDLQWIVRNEGGGPTRAGNWIDRVYLSTDTTLDAGDTLLVSGAASFEFPHTGDLAAGEEYSRSDSMRLPVGIEGEFFILVATDVNDAVYEQSFESDNILASGPIQILLTPPPDLEVTAISLEGELLSSHPIVVHYTVANNGSTATGSVGLTDRIYLSTDSVLDAGDTLLDEFSYTRTSLAPGNSYARTARTTLPDAVEGDFFLLVQVDATDRVFEIDNANNVGSNPITILNRPADLIVTDLQVPASAVTDESIEVQWTVANTGIGSTGATNWVDKIYLSTDGTFENRILLGSFGRTGQLGAGESETRQGFVSIPYDVGGSVSIFVVTDAPLTRAEDGNNVIETGPGGLVFEESAEGNNTSALAPINVTLVSPDLFVIDSLVPTSASSAETISLAWTTQNQGGVRTNSNIWYDDIYLSTDADLSGDDILLGSRFESAGLAAGASRSINLDVTLPATLSAGTYFLLIAIDRPQPTTLLGFDTNRIQEGAFENNNVASIEVTLTEHPVPNLVPSAITAPTNAIASRPIEIGWTVTNTGQAPTNGTWIDNVFLSFDQIFDPQVDRYLGFVNRPNDLGPSESYVQNATFTLPTGLAGAFYVFVVTDGNGRIFERAGEGDNIAYRPTATSIVLAEPVDLTVSDISVEPPIPDGFVAGQPFSFTYELTNLGTSTAFGGWQDRIYLSRDGVVGLDDVLVAQVTQTADLLAGQSVETTLSLDLPAVIEGSYRLIVETDARRVVIETDETNNTSASNAFAVEVLPLFEGLSASFTVLPSTARLFRFEATAGSSIEFAVVGAGPLDGIELFVSQDRVPTRQDADARTSILLNQEPRLTIPDAEAATYYVLVLGTDVDEAGVSVSINTQILPFALVAVDETTAAPLGPVTLGVDGSQFDRTTLFELVGPSDEILPQSAVQFEDSSRAYVTFNLAGAALGAYRLRATKGTETVELAGAINVTPGIAGEFQVVLDGPDSYFPNRPGALTVVYRNVGDTDVPVPLLTLAATENAAIGLFPEDLATGRIIQLIAVSPTGPAGILRPGQTVSIPLYFRSPVGNSAVATYTVGSLAANDPRPIDPDVLESQSQPVNLDDATWQPIFSELKDLIGPTWGDYVRTLSRYASLLPPELGEARRQADVLRLVVDDAWAAISTSMTGRVFAESLSIPIAGRSLRALNVDTGETFLTTTRNDGGFVLPNLTAGTYEFQVEGALTPAGFQATLAGGDQLADIVIPIVVGGSVQGRILTESNAPITEGFLLLHDRDNERIFSTSIGPGGTYRFEGLLPGTYTLEVTAPGRAQAVAGPLVITGGDSIARDVVMQPESVITAEVVLPIGATVNDLIIMSATPAVPIDLVGIFSTRTPTRNLRLDGLPAGSYTVTIELEGYLPVTRTDQVLGTAETLDLGIINLIPSASVGGTVQINDPLLPDASPTVRLLQLDVVVATTVADSETGAFEFQDLPAGDYTIEVFPIVGFGTSQNVTLATGDQLAGLVLETNPGGSIVGSVTDDRTGEPVPNARVFIYGPTGTFFDALADADGNYRFDRLALGSYTVALPIGGVDSTKVVEIASLSGSEIVADLSFSSLATVRGTLRTTGGEAFSNTAVALLKGGSPVATTTTDSTGNFAFHLISVGSFEIQPLALNGSFAPTPVTILLGETTLVDIVAGGSTVELNLTDALDPVEGSSVSISRMTGDDLLLSGINIAGADGIVRFENLIAGDYSVQVTSPTGRGARFVLSLDGASSVTQSVAFESRARLEGTITAAGQPVGGAFVVLYDRLTGRSVGLTSTDPDGRYAFVGLDAGTYDIVVRESGFQAAVVDSIVVTDSASADADLTPSTTQLQGIVIDFAGRPVPAGLIVVRDSEGRTIGRGFTDASGQFNITTAVGENLTVEISAEGYEHVVIGDVNLAEGTSENLGALGLVGVSAAGSASVAAAQNADAGTAAEANGPATNDDEQAAQDLADLLNFDPSVVPVNVNKELVYINLLDNRIVDYDELERRARTADPGDGPDCPECQKAYSDLVTAINEQEELLRKFIDANKKLKDLRNLAIPIYIGEIDSQFVVPFLVPFAKFTGFLANLIPGILQYYLGAQQVVDDLSTASTAKDFSTKASFVGVGANDAVATVSGVASTFVSLAQSHNDEILEFGTKFGLFASVVNLLANLRVGKVLESSIDVANKIDVAEAILKTMYQELEAKLEKTQRAEKAYIECIVKNSDCEDPDVPGPPTSDPPKPPPHNPNDEHSIPNNTPNDPNDILGPAGFGEDRWVGTEANPVLSYLVRFENKSDATASVHEATIETMLDDDLDFRTFRFGDITIAGKRFEITGDSSFLDTRLDLTEEFGVFVDVLANIDVRTGEVFWLFGAIDPETGGTPADPRVGFLPPNLEGGIGEASVAYSVQPKSTANTGDAIDAQATIVFDTQPPIDTPIWTNTLDQAAPETSVNVLPATTTALNFLVSWTADDASGSGLGGVSIFVSENGGPFELWLNNVATGSAIFAGQAESTYAFYSTGTDNAGNRERPPLAPDAQTRTVPLLVVDAPSKALLNQTVTVNVSFANFIEPLSGITAALIDWNNDGQADQLSTGQDVIVFKHTFESLGPQTYVVSLLGDGGRLAAQVTRTIEVSASFVASNPDNPTLLDLHFAGTSGADRWTIEELSPTTIRITTTDELGNPVDVQTFDDITGMIHLASGAGDDFIDASSITQHGFDIDAGSGEDTILTGAGDDLIFADGAEGSFADSVDSGAGNDRIDADGAEGTSGAANGPGDTINAGVGNDIVLSRRGPDVVNLGEGADIVVTGKGADSVDGMEGSDLIITGTAGNLGLSDFVIIQSEWITNRPLPERVANITGQGEGPRNNGDTFLTSANVVVSDAAVDVVLGGADEDWLIAEPLDSVDDFDPLDDILGLLAMTP